MEKRYESITCHIGKSMTYYVTGKDDYKKLLHQKAAARGWKSYTEEEIEKLYADEKTNMTPEQLENQRLAAIDIVGPDPFFNKSVMNTDK